MAVCVLTTPIFYNIIFLSLHFHRLPFSLQQTVSETFDDAVGLQRGEDDVHKPQAEEQAGGEDLGESGASELSPDFRSTPVHEHTDSHEGKDGEDRDGECQCSRIHQERSALRCVVDGSDGPRHTDAQEDIDSVAPGDVADGGICILVLDRRNFTGKCIWRKRRRKS